MERINVEYIPEIWDDLISLSRTIGFKHDIVKRLANCSAYIHCNTEDDCKTLVSYITPVAFYDIHDNTVLDYSRIVHREYKYLPNADTLPQPMAKILNCLNEILNKFY